MLKTVFSMERYTVFATVIVLSFVSLIGVIWSWWFLLPFVIFALVSGNWKAGGITIGVIVALVVITFKLIERKWRRGFAATLSEVHSGPTMPDENEPATAGPSDPRQRRQQLDQLLSRAGLPSLAEIEPHFDSDVPMAV